MQTVITSHDGVLRALLAALLICLLASPRQAQSADEQQVRELTQVFYRSYERRNASTTLAWWSGQAPGLTSYKRQLENLFANSSRIELTRLTVRQVEWDGPDAKVRVDVEFNAVAAKTNQPFPEWAKLKNVLVWRKENNEWKLWQEVSAYVALAQKLLSAPTVEAPQSLLAAAPELYDTELARYLNRAGNGTRFSNQDLTLKAFQLAYEIAWQVGDKERAATSLNNLALAHFDVKAHSTSLDFAQRALQLNSELNNPAGLADALDSVANAQQALGQYAAAKPYYERSLPLRQTLPDLAKRANLFNNFGAWHHHQGAYDKALEFYQQALGLRLTLQQQNPSDTINLAELGTLQSNIGLVYAERGEHARALKLFEESLATARARERGEGPVLNNIGTLYQRQGNYDLAERYYRLGLQANERQKAQREIAVSHNFLGDIYRAQERWPQALEHYQRARAIGESLSNRSLLYKTHNLIGAVLQAQQKYQAATSQFQTALSLSRQINLPETLAESNYNLASVYAAQQDFAQARVFAEQALEFSSQLNMPELRQRVCTNAGNIYQALKQPEQARRVLMEAIAIIERLRGEVAGDEQNLQSFFENMTAPYLALTELSLAQAKPAEALAYAERAKARALLDVLRSGKLSFSKVMTQAEQQQERKLLDALAGLNLEYHNVMQAAQRNPPLLAGLTQMLNVARLDYEDFRTRLYAAHPELKIQRGEAQPLTLAEANALLPDARTALLSYVVTADRVQLFVLTKAQTGEAQLRVFPLVVKRDELAKQVEQFRRLLAERDARYGKLAGQLYAALLRPARAALPAQARLMIVPDGPLWELPFQALLDERGRHLWETHVIAYAPSLTVLREMAKLRRPITGQPSLLAVGDPALGGKSLERAQALLSGALDQLPEARAQVAQLRKFYDAQHSKIFVGVAAAEAAVKAQAGAYDILHFATHGILNDRNPLYSHILLAQADGVTTDAEPRAAQPREDGLLEAWEIMQMDLRAELVVLSACETARGRVGAGEGMIGLTWALFVAGVPTTVVSQWKVRADSTAALMVEFHRLLQARKSQRTPSPTSAWTKAEALQQAALKLLRGGQYRHPFYWAGFVLVGDAR